MITAQHIFTDFILYESKRRGNGAFSWGGLESLSSDTLCALWVGLQLLSTLMLKGLKTEV